MKLAAYLLLPIVASAIPPAAIAQLHVSETAKVKAVTITLHPAPEPRPALKYRLLPTMPDFVEGNAAVWYGKVTAEQITLFSDGEFWLKIDRWGRAPLEELRRDKVLKQLRLFSPVYYHLERGARCETCDWLLPIDEGNFYSMLLPDVQQTRGFARFLAARARAEIAEGKLDEAIHTLEIGYALGRHAAAGETMINGLVGIAICSMMSRQVQDLLQQPEAPNLYWALTRLPRPLIDMDRALQAEMNAVRWSFPEIQDAENSTQDAQYWRHALLAFWQKFAPFLDGPDFWMDEGPEALAAVCLRGYPIAKRDLIDQGMSPQRVEAMPVGQVMAIHTMRTYDHFQDDMFKWCYTPYWIADEQSAKASQRFAKFYSQGREAIPLASMLIPAVRAFQTAVVRNEREIALLRALEAFRLFAAAHDGKLPQTLDDVTQVPVPDDPVTGQPFSYRRQGELAVLEGEPRLPGLILRLEIRAAK